MHLQPACARGRPIGRALLAIVVVVSMFVASMTGGVSAARTPQRTIRVTISNFAFHPATITITVGTRVIWINTDSDPHTVAAVRGQWQSEALDTDTQFTHVFRAIGKVGYYCTIHPFMHGTIIVKRR